MSDLIRREDALAVLDLAEHDAEERDWRSGANAFATLARGFRASAALATPASDGAQGEGV